MMKKAWIAALAALAIGFSGYVTEVDAKRMGGGRSLGQQNNITRQATPPPAAPSQAQQSAAARQQNAAPAAAQAQNRSRWMAPLAGLAAGLGLAWLASSLGLGEEFATIMLILLLGMLALVAFRIFMARRAASAPNGGRGGFAYQGAGAGARAPQPTDARYQLPGAAREAAAGMAGGGAAGSAAGAGAAAGGAAGFDVDQFVRAAQGQFTRLQAAFDTGRVDELREFTSPQMFDELQRELAERGGRAQTTEILTLNGEFLGTERFDGTSGQELAAVRFTGLLRESPDESAQPIDEVWNFTRPLDRSGGWVLAGIQQAGGVA